jgi:hypothetical protein
VQSQINLTVGSQLRQGDLAIACLPFLASPLMTVIGVEHLKDQQLPTRLNARGRELVWFWRLM